MLPRSLFLHGDPYQSTDPVFGAKQSLVAKITKADANLSARYGIPEGADVLPFDFVLVAEEECLALRNKNTVAALSRLGRKCHIVNGLPVPNVQ
jgi:hypothetical protein